MTDDNKKKAPAYTEGEKGCRLCLKEKLYMSEYSDASKLSYQKKKLQPKCINLNKVLLCSLTLKLIPLISSKKWHWSQEIKEDKSEEAIEGRNREDFFS